MSPEPNLSQLKYEKQNLPQCTRYEYQVMEACLCARYIRLILRPTPNARGFIAYKHTHYQGCNVP